MNAIVLGDNLRFLKSLPDGSVDLIYVDPPFNTGKKQQRNRIAVEKDAQGDRIGFGGRRYKTKKRPSVGYNDTFFNFHTFIRVRLAEAFRVLKPTGSLFLHMDYREVHYCKIMLDEIFGRPSFINEIVWAYDYGARSKTRWSAKHDTILWYAKNPRSYTFHYNEIERIPYMAPEMVGPEKAARGKTLTDCYSADTEILTEDGWKFFKDLGGERVATVSSDLVLTFIKPTAYQSYQYVGDMVELSTKTIDMCITPNHRVFCKPKRSEYQFVLAKDISGYQFVSLPNKLLWKGRDQARFNLPTVPYRVDTQGQAYKSFPMEPWLELVGRYVSDGTTTNYRDRREVFIAEVKPRKIAQTDRVLKALGIKYHRTPQGACICNKQLWSYFSVLGAHAWEKRIPPGILDLSQHYLKFLWRGLLNGDGHIKRVAGQANQESFCTTSVVLKDQVQELLLKLGSNSSVSEKHPDGLGRQKHTRYNIFRRVARESTIWSKHVGSLRYNGWVYCVTVEPHHTIVVRRNGRVCVGGNCWWHTIVATNGKEKTGYATQKPLGILNRIVKVHSNPGELLLDFFAGSGSFGEAAGRLGRQFVMVDNNPDAVTIMRARLAEFEPEYRKL